MADAPAPIENRRPQTMRIIVLAAAGLTLVAAIFLRFSHLDARVMHGDEAVNTVKFAQLARLPPYDGEPYRYDPHEYHGPTLPYLTFAAKWLTGADTYAATSESFYRSVTAVAGVLLVIVTMLLGRFIGWPAALAAALLVALSPSMVFYSRYYIHEMPLVLFTAVAILAGFELLHEDRPWPWAILMGVSVGLMHATKETFAISVAVMILAFIAAEVLTELTTRGESPRAIHARLMGHVTGVHTIIVFAAGGVAATLLFTGFFSNPRGILDAFLTYGAWLRIGAEGAGGAHLNPFDFYLDRLFWHPLRPSLHVGEWAVASLAVVGLLAAVTGRGVDPRFLHPARCFAFYAPLLTLIYCLIPYKTPWSILSAYHGLIVLAGVGAAAILRLTPTRPLKVIAALLLLAAAAHLGSLNSLINFRYPNDPKNPWVYAHPVGDLRNLVDRVHGVADASPLGRDLPVIVVADYEWPLPFYLRDLRRVGYYRSVPALRPVVPIVICSIAHYDGVKEQLGLDKYQAEHFGHRPGVVLRVFIRRDLFDAMIAARSAASP